MECTWLVCVTGVVARVRDDWNALSGRMVQERGARRKRGQIRTDARALSALPLHVTCKTEPGEDTSISRTQEGKAIELCHIR